jgi:hypothetical protein
MATPHTQITPKQLEALSYQYIDECINNHREQPTAAGKVISIKDRHIPTIDYFLRIWIPNQHKPTINRSTYYQWLKSNDLEKSNTIKSIDELFKALAVDIVANEGKGIFYAKNRLGMSDKQQIEQIELPKVTTEMLI